jgi:hypothetical protein
MYPISIALITVVIGGIFIKEDRNVKWFKGTTDEAL